MKLFKKLTTIVILALIITSFQLTCSAALELQQDDKPNAIQEKIKKRPQGYELYWDGNRVGHEPKWSYQQAINNLKWNINQYPNKRVEGYYNGKKITLEGSTPNATTATGNENTQGYVLYWNGKRVGHEPKWSYEQGINNLKWNMNQYPNKRVEGYYNGKKIIFEGSTPDVPTTPTGNAPTTPSGNAPTTPTGDVPTIAAGDEACVVMYYRAKYKDWCGVGPLQNAGCWKEEETVFKLSGGGKLSEGKFRLQQIGIYRIYWLGWKLKKGDMDAIKWGKKYYSGFPLSR